MVSRSLSVSEGLAIIVNHELVAQLGIDSESALDVTAVGGSLIITPIRGQEHRETFREALKQTNEQYGEALHRLAE